jgi:hypothetical protein
MEMDQRIPDLSDKELESLHENAVRLAQSGNDRQRQQAESLLPLIAAQLETRRAARAEVQAEKRATSKKAAKAKAAD